MAGKHENPSVAPRHLEVPVPRPWAGDGRPTAAAGRPCHLGCLLTAVPRERERRRVRPGLASSSAAGFLRAELRASSSGFPSLVLLLGTGKQRWPGSCDRGSASPWAWGWPCVWFYGPRPPILVPLDRLLMPGLVQRMPVSPLPAAGRGAEHGSDWGLLEGCSGCRRRTTWFGQADVGSIPGPAGYSLLLFDLISSTASTSHKPQISGRWIITCMGKQKF